MALTGICVGLHSQAIRATDAQQLTPPIRKGEFVQVGELPECHAGGEARANADAVRVNEPLTVTLRLKVACPQMLHDRAAILVLGGITEPDLVDTRGGMRLLIDALEGQTHNRVALLDVAVPTPTPEWAATAESFGRLKARIDAVESRSALPSTQWLDALDVATRLVRETDAVHTPLVIVVDGTGTQFDQAAVNAVLVQLAESVRDHVGQTVVLDHSRGARFGSTLPNPEAGDSPIVTLVAQRHSGGTALGLAWLLVTTFTGDIKSVRVGISIFEGPPFETSATSPPADVMDAQMAEWYRPAGEHVFLANWTAVARSTEAGEALISFGISADRTGVTLGHGANGSAIVAFCFAPPAPAALGCPTVAPPPTPVPAPTTPAPTGQPQGWHVAFLPFQLR